MIKLRRTFFLNTPLKGEAMTESTQDIQEYIEELDAIIEEFNTLEPEEQADSEDFHKEILALRKKFDEFESLSEEEQDKVIQSTEALFFSISLFSDLDDEDLEDMTEWDEYDEEDFEDEEIDGATLEELSGILSKLTETMQSDNPEDAEKMKEQLMSLLSDANISDTEIEEHEEKTIPISES